MLRYTLKLWALLQKRHYIYDISGHISMYKWQWRLVDHVAMVCRGNGVGRVIGVGRVGLLSNKDVKLLSDRMYTEVTDWIRTAFMCTPAAAASRIPRRATFRFLSLSLRLVMNQKIVLGGLRIQPYKNRVLRHNCPSIQNLPRCGTLRVPTTDSLKICMFTRKYSIIHFSVTWKDEMRLAMKLAIARPSQT